jgi:hypothetical protein
MGKTIALYMGAVVLLAVIGWAIWGLGVATAGIFGQGEAHKEIQSSDFRIQAYQTFFNQCASIQGLEGQIDELVVALEYYERGSREYNITVTSIAGVKGARHQAIAKYNQDALKNWTEGQFRDADLPYHLPDTNYPDEGGKTICAAR